MTGDYWPNHWPHISPYIPLNQNIPLGPLPLTEAGIRRIVREEIREAHVRIVHSRQWRAWQRIRDRMILRA